MKTKEITQTKAQPQQPTLAAAPSTAPVGKTAALAAGSTVAPAACCGVQKQQSCCAPAAKASCCGTPAAPGSCGCQ